MARLSWGEHPFPSRDEGYRVLREDADNFVLGVEAVALLDDIDPAELCTQMIKDAVARLGERVEDE